MLAFWQPASRVLPVLRERSPDTRVIVDSIDLHFLRDARRTFGAGADLEHGFGSQMVGELNTYRGADAVLTVSAKEAAMLADFLGPERVFDVPLAEPMTRSTLGFDERHGIFFVGNFRHLPNGEAVEYLCRDILPRLDPELLAAPSAHGRREPPRREGRSPTAAAYPRVQMVGWVPSILPYLERARVCAVPLLHGAGVKGKIVESLMAGTPVVTTPIGAEGLDLRHGEHAVIADTSADLAAGLTHLLTDREQWQRLADAGYDLAAQDPRSGRAIRERFLDDRRAHPRAARSQRDHRIGRVRPGAQARARVSGDRGLDCIDASRTVTDPGSTVLVVSRGDDALTELHGRTGPHFPQASDGSWAGYHPADSDGGDRATSRRCATAAPGTSPSRAPRSGGCTTTAS